MAVTKKDIKLMIEESEKNIINIIAGNTKIQTDKMDQIIQQISTLTVRITVLENKNNELERKILDIEENCVNIKKENEDLKESLQFTQDELIEKKIEMLQNRYDEEFDKLYENNNNLKEQNRKLEDRTRRCNLRIDGITEKDYETWDETESKVQEIFKEKLHLEHNIEIERAHRMKRRPNNSNNNNNQNEDKSPRPKTVILKLLRYKDKELILKNAKKLKGTGIFINEDFSDETNLIRMNLKAKMKKARENGKYCVISYDRLVTRDFKSANLSP